jgi:uncharacterized protein (DUF2141 family)
MAVTAQIQVSNTSPEELKQRQICYAIFAEPKGFPDTLAFAENIACLNLSEFTIEAKAKNKSTFQLKLPLLMPSKTYALSVFIDENRDQKLNKSFFGIPSEAFGFSNNPRIAFSAPSFGDCKWKTPVIGDMILSLNVSRYLTVSNSSD